MGIDEWIWSIGRLVVTRANRNTWRNCVSAMLSTTNHTWTALGLNSRFLDDRPVADPLSHGKAEKKMDCVRNEGEKVRWTQKN
jgi:hypothetical protein